MSSDNQIPIRLVTSMMIAIFAMVLTVFLILVGYHYTFKWPGIVKSVVCGLLAIACGTYHVARGRYDIKLVRALPSGQTQVGFAHVGVIMGTVFLLTALAIWIMAGPPYFAPPF